ncbi:hypothetical protein ACOME3_006764 [Neoechinorhynchus agilis]
MIVCDDDCNNQIDLSDLFFKLEEDRYARNTTETEAVDEVKVRVRVPFGQKLILDRKDLWAELLFVLRSRLSSKYGQPRIIIDYFTCSMIHDLNSVKSLSCYEDLREAMSTGCLTSSNVADSDLVDDYLFFKLKQRHHSCDYSPSTPVRSSSYAVRNKRTHMEDFYVSIDRIRHPFTGQQLSIHLVVDGHGGADTALYTIRMVPFMILDSRECIDQFKLREMFKQIQASIVRRKNIDRLAGGCTASLVVVCDDVVYVCWLGDTAVYAIDESGLIKFKAKSHKPDRKDEFDRISRFGGVVSKSGGDVFRINGTMAVSRSLGDIQLHPYVSSDCEIQVLRISSLKYIMIGTDGFSDYCSDSDLLSALYRTNHQEIGMDNCVRHLVSIAQQNKSSDNICLILVDLNMRSSKTFSADSLKSARTSYNQSFSTDETDIHLTKQRSSAIVDRPRMVVCNESGLRGYVSD